MDLLCLGATVARPPAGDEQKAFNGSCIVARAASKEEVLAEIRKDIYATEGVWNLDKIIIHPVRRWSSPLSLQPILTCLSSPQLMTAFRKELPGALW
jgi:hypothetical protein